MSQSLQEFLNLRGFYHFEGYSEQNPSQVNDLIRLTTGNNIRHVMEIGFNAGHSANVFLQNNPTIDLVIPEHGFLLKPGEVYLYAVNERIGVKGNIRAKVEGKSSLGRLGLFIHVTAGFIDTGFEGSLVLELVATRPIMIYPNMKICQIEFARVEGEINETYDQKAGSKYHNQTGVQESLMHKNFTDGKDS